jgi:HSP20 family protein
MALLPARLGGRNLPTRVFPFREFEDVYELDVQVQDRDVVVTGEIVEREQGRWFRRARPVGRFEYRSQLPGDISPEKVSAELADGVLTVTVPKAETARPRRIEITG